MATRDIQAGDCLVCVPESLLLTATQLRSHYSRELARCSTAPQTHTLMAYHVAAERVRGAEKSRIWPYISVLPGDFDTLPVCYPMSLRALLPDTVQEMAQQQRERIDLGFATLCSEFLHQNLSAPRITAETFEWGWLNDGSDTAMPGDCVAMAPFLDMLNHHPDAQMRAYFDTKTRCYTIRTDNTFHRGRQAFISYGPHDNCFLLGEYGFVTADNRYNHVLLGIKELRALADAVAKSTKETAQSALRERRGMRSRYDRRPVTVACTQVDAAADMDEKMRFLEQEGLLGDYALYSDGEIPLRLVNALRIWLLPQFRTENQETQRAIHIWRQSLYSEACSVDKLAQASGSQLVPESAVWMAVKMMLVQATRLAEDRLEQLRHLGTTLETRFQLGLTFTRQLWEESLAILRICLGTACRHLDCESIDTQHAG
ncbi:hypothetical protein THASP1DRAFT_30053 [Thamnocephalis sphaerospora]|uniref:SET domain-containing protein n=1 Tax=Thamnocephalis sphaerospora TaxID=78915 RepID=A0A4P9XQ41_9FUNG|nr:hypothetical protein THASP1DRAFT_30053 [Thamnocephalis sphaerospora]|eukprot:RKP08136.1 hypothetical protein THASP1DRAFT_30053 [Thamnocephalis sphaerospora]